MSWYFTSSHVQSKNDHQLTYRALQSHAQADRRKLPACFLVPENPMQFHIHRLQLKDYPGDLITCCILWDSRSWGNKPGQGSMDLLYFFQKRHLQKLVNFFGGLGWVDMYRERWEVSARLSLSVLLGKGICQRTGQVPSGCVQFLLLPPGEGQVRCPWSLGFHGFTKTHRKNPRQDKKIQCRWRCYALALQTHRLKLHPPFFGHINPCIATDRWNPLPL